MSNSSLVTYTKYSPNHSGRRTQPIRKIAIHHMAGNLSVETCANVFASPARQASSNYGIGSDGRVGLYVDEANRAWTTSSAWCDQQAVTIEVANSSVGGNWPISDAAIKSLINLVTDICKRNGIKNCTYTGDKSGVLQKHEWYSATNCPGPYLGSKFSYIASEANKRLNGAKVSTSASKINYASYPAGNYRALRNISVRKEPSLKAATTGAIKYGSIFKATKELRTGVPGVWLQTVDGYVPAQQGRTVYVQRKRANSTYQSRSGTWRFSTAVNVRSDPSTHNPPVAVYQPGQTVSILDTVVKSGYEWGHYISYSGHHRYVALKPVGGEPYGTWV